MSFLTPPRLYEPQRWAGMRIGLLGGSFNPPHEGHVHISLAALHGLELDAVWWLVSPQNPLKMLAPLPVEARMGLARDLIDHPRIVVSDLEGQLGTSITYHSIRQIKSHFPASEFVWVSGMDNALSLHTWHHWRELLDEIPMLHLSRKPASSMIRRCPLRLYTKQNHVHLSQSGRYCLSAGTTYWMMQKKIVPISSTDIRNGHQ